MKKFDLRILSLIISISGLFFSHSLIAQNARTQWINNSAAINLDTVDIYVDGTKIADNLLFKSATGILNLTSGAHSVNINNATSIDSSDMVISRNAITLQNNSNNTIFIVGVDNTSIYAANPSGRTTDVQLIDKKGVLFGTSSSSSSAITFFNGITDNEGINISTRPTGAVINISKLKYKDTTASITPISVPTIIDIKDTTGTQVIKTLLLPLNNYGKKSLTIFNSGFVNPSSNQNGDAIAYYMVDTNGGPATKITEISRVQFINNAADIILDTVDIWFNNNKIASALGFSKATNTFSVNSGSYDITITKKNSPDTSGSNVVYKIPAFNFQTGKSYLGLLSGVVNPSQYAVNPDAVNRSIKLTLVNDNTEYSNVANQVSTRFFNAVTDAPQFTVQRNPAAPTTLFGPLSYGSISSATNITSNAIQVLIEQYNGVTTNSYRLNTALEGGKSAVISAIGFIDTVGNVTGASAKLYKYMITYSDGNQSVLTPLQAKIQMIHGSADPSINKFKLFMNGVSIANNISFRTAIAGKALIAYKPYRFHLAPISAVDTSSAYYNFNIVPDSGKFYYAIAVGLKNASGYAANPDNIDRTFTVLINANGKEIAGFNSKNVDLMYLNAMTDAPATTSRGIGQTLFLSKSDLYKGFHGFNAHSGFNNIIFDVLNDNNDSVLFTCLGNLTNHKGQAGIVVASGFTKPSDNNNGETAMMFVTWPDGATDSLPFPSTGLKQNTFDASEILVYPVPANNQINLSINVITKTLLTTELIDITGKTLLTKVDKLNRLKNIAKLDLRALALMRIAVGFILLLDLFIRSNDILAFYTDQGVLPSIAIVNSFDPFHLLSFHLLNGSIYFQYFLFFVFAIFAYCLLVGYQTRIFTILCWVMLVSLHNRNPLIIQGGDDLLRLTLFWGIFLPWGKRLSIDKLISNSNNQDSTYTSLFGLAYILQVCYVYGFSALQKGPEWNTDFTALYYVYHLEQINYGLATYLSNFPTLLKVLTAIAYYFELFVPFFILSPIKNSFFRTIGIITIILFHLWNGFTIQIGLFFVIGMVTTLGLLPESAITYLSKIFNRNHHILNRYLFNFYVRLKHLHLIHLPNKLNAYQPIKLRKWSNAIAFTLIIYILLINIGNVSSIPFEMSISLKEPSYWFRLDQNWGMFAPGVYKDDGWYIYEGITENGDTIDIRNKGELINYNKPNRLVSTFKNDRWRKYGEQITLDQHAHVRPYLSRFLYEKWNAENPQKKIRQVKVLFMLEPTLPDYQESPITRTLISAYY